MKVKNSTVLLMIAKKEKKKTPVGGIMQCLFFWLIQLYSIVTVVQNKMTACQYKPWKPCSHFIRFKDLQLLLISINL